MRKTKISFNKTLQHSNKSLQGFAPKVLKIWVFANYQVSRVSGCVNLAVRFNARMR